MKQFVGIYHMVKLVNRATQAIEKEANPSPQLYGYKGGHVVTLSAKKDYVEKYKKTTIQKTQYIIVDAIKKGYLEGHTEHISGEKVDTLCMTTKGRKLLDMPLGTFQEFFSEYGEVVSFLTGGIAVAIMAALLKWMWHVV